MTIKDLTDTPDFSKESIKKLGRKIRTGEDYDQDMLDRFIIWNSEVVEYCTQLARSHYLDKQYIYNNLPQCLKNKIITPDIEFSSRVKTIDTIEQKLQRLNETSLDRIQDIAGIRIDGLLTLKNQEAVAKSLKSAFISSGAKKAKIKNLATSPHAGYRAVHLCIESRAGCAEVQIRTHLQSAWANAYEALADVMGRDIRYTDENNFEPEDPPKALISISEYIHQEQERFDDVIDTLVEQELYGHTPSNETIQQASQRYHNLANIHKSLDQFVEDLRSPALE